MPNIAKNTVKHEYASWLATPRRLKASLSLPATKKDFAHMKGVNPRTLSRWEAQEDFQRLVEQRKMELANATPNSTVAAIGGPKPKSHGNAKVAEVPEPAVMSDDPVWDSGLSEDEQKYAQVKDTLVRMAMDGNQGAIDLYMKHYGKPFIDAEQKAGFLFPDLSDEALVNEICVMLGPEVLADFLSRHTVIA